MMGHVPLGIRQLLPERTPDGREVRFFTFLREPVDRTLSHYFAMKGSARGLRESAKFGLARLPPEPSLEEMVASGHLHDNLHTRMLSGDLEPFGEVDDAMLEQAKRNLREGLIFFGLTERFDESLVLAQRRLGLTTILQRAHERRGRRPVTSKDGRVNASRPRGADVPQELVQAAERCNRFDIELYCYAEKLFGATEELADLDLRVGVAALRAARAEGEIDLGVPAPDGFTGSHEEWRLLLHARATLVRCEADIAAMKAVGRELGQRYELAREILGRIREGQYRALQNGPVVEAPRAQRR